MGETSVGRTVSAALNPVLAHAGFAGGQYGEGGTDPYAQIIFCAGHDEFSDRYPWMRQANEQDRGVGTCVDLVVDVSVDRKIDAIALDGRSLELTLRDVAHPDDADKAAGLGTSALRGASVAVCGPGTAIRAAGVSLTILGLHGPVNADAVRVYAERAAVLTVGLRRRG